ncbi:uncharacterized protein [Phaseolus vulgaris]|uniref:uncharacterized protein n=1 Tax=Phaseolus vulgaris TaxID=3885 RepID=UPI0035C9EDF1
MSEFNVLFAEGSAIVKDEQVEKPRSEWNDTERRKAQHDLVAKNIITSALTMDEFFRISQCKSAKEMWEVLEVTHEGTEDVKRSRKHALIQEYELFRMQPGENIADCLDRSWQPKVTAISESRDLSKLGTTALFGKLMEHELELKRLKEQETTERKPKGLALKATELDEIKEEKEDAEDDDTINLLTKRFSKFLRKKSKNRNQQKRSKKFERNKGRRAYISWEENEVSSTSSSSTEDEENNLCFMMKDEESSSESIVKDEQVEKPRSEWNDTERRKAQHDLVAKNIITSALTMDEFFRISQCKSAKEMWEVLEVTHEGTEDVKRSRKHALIQEYELFRMQPGENIADCLDRSWQPKVTAISESRDLSKLGTTALFGKLMEHELELKRLKEQETTERKPKGLALKATELDEIKEEKEDAEDDDTINLLTKRFSKFLRKKSKNRNQQKRSKKFERNKGRRAYISWEENEVSSTSSSSTEDEENNLCFMMKDEESSSESINSMATKRLWRGTGPLHDESRSTLKSPEPFCCRCYACICKTSESIIEAGSLALSAELGNHSSWVSPSGHFAFGFTHKALALQWVYG